MKAKQPKDNDNVIALDADSHLLTIEEVSQRLKVSRVYLYPLLNSGLLKSVTLGRRRFVTIRQLHEYITSLENKHTPTPAECTNNRWRPKKSKQQRSQRAVA